MKKVTMQEYLDELHAKEAKMMEPAAVSKAIAGLAAELWYGVTKDKIVFRTDYDADGICSAYILSKAMMAVHPDKKIEVRVNDRRGSYAALEDPADDTVQYIVMDMGSNALPALSERYGDVLVVDHHLVNQAEDLEEIRKNPRFLNPKTIGEGLCDYCTTGLAYRLYQELNKISEKENGKPLLDIKVANALNAIAAIGTIADSVNLMDEFSQNRAIVKSGMTAIDEATRQIIGDVHSMDVIFF